ncbi:MAG: hypothetical protein ABJL99_15065 [Aliishimia sp.]
MGVFDTDIFAFQRTAISIGGQLTSENISSALNERGHYYLTDHQTSIFDDASKIIDHLSTLSDLSFFDVQSALDGKFEFQSVNGLEATDGTKLNGAATEDGLILIDASLQGDLLLSTVIEEIAEASYYKAFGEVSIGDFGAEVAYRSNGGDDARYLAHLQSAYENDTVLTEWGQAQAAQTYAAGVHLHKEGWQFPVDRGQMMNSGFKGEGPFGSFFDNADTATADFTKAVIRSYDEGLYSQYTGSMVGYDTKTIDLSGLNNAGLNLNQDERGDLFSFVGTMKWDDFASAPNPVSVTASNYNAVATSQAQTILIGQGKVITSWSVTTGETYTTATEVNLSSSVTGTIGYEGGVEGLAKVTASVSATVDTGLTVTDTSAFSVTSNVKHVYEIPAGAYDPSTLVSYGFHMLTADITVTETVIAVARLTTASDLTYLFVPVEVVTEIEDFGIGLILTDYDIASQPDLSVYL